MNQKYNFEKMKIGGVRKFSIDEYSKIRIAACLYGKKYGMKFSTKKNIKTVSVERKA